MKAKAEFPQKVTVGNSTVTVYQRNTASGNPGYMVAYRDSAGKRKFDSYPAPDLALAQAKQTAQRLSVFGVRVAQIKPDEIAKLVGVRDKLSPFGVDFALCADFLVRWLGQHQTLENIETALTLHRADTARTGEVRPITVAKAVEVFQQFKEDNGASDCYNSELRWRLKKLTADFVGNVHSITGPMLQQWFDNQKFTPKSYMNFRGIFNVFFQYCLKRQHTLKNPVEGVESQKIKDDGKVEIFTPDEMRRLLAVANGDGTAYLVICGFAGLRGEEFQRLEWEQVDLAEGYIVLNADQAKTASRRVVPMSANLKAWLLKCKPANATGKVWPEGRELWVTQKKMGDAAKIPWRKNALRHCFCSYRMAESGDATRVAFEAGNSPKMIHRHYKALVTAAQAKEWFGIMP